MSETITISAHQWRKINEKLDAVLALVTPIVRNFKKPDWLSEEETMHLTGLSKRSLLNYRNNGTFNYSSGTGRKIKYRRLDVEKFINDNSTIINP
jgi:predicted DNA-binding transcriptional regulator AlpA